MSATVTPDNAVPRGGWWARASAWSRFQAVALTVFVVGHVVLQLLYVNWYIEDAAISFSFAKHLAEGEGLVAYPGGERVEGYSNPTWTLLMAAFHLVGVDGFWSSKIMGAAFGGATVLITWDIARRTRKADDVVPLVAAFLLALNPQFVIWAASGLENSLFCWFLALGTWLVLGELRESHATRFPWSSVAFLGLAITRPEGILYAALGGFWAMVFSLHAGRGVVPTVKWLIGFFAPFTAYHAVRYSYFAWAFPNTYYSKLGRADYDPSRFDSKGWKYVRDWAHELWQGWFAPVYVVAMTGLGRGLSRSVRGRSITIPVAVWPLLLLGAALLVPGPAALTDLGWWPHVPTPARWASIQVWLLAAVAVLGPILAIGRPGWQSLVLNWSFAIIGVYFAIHASGDWMRGFRWLSLIAGPQAVLFAVGVAEIGDAVSRRWPARGEVAGWVWGLSRAWNVSWSLPAGVLAAVLVGLVVPPDVAYLEFYTRKSETNPYKIQRRVNYMHYVQHRLHLDHVVSLDVDMGGTMWWSGHEIVDIAGLVDVPLGHHSYQKEFVREYVFEERRPHFAHLHGGWEKKMGVKALPEYERTYHEIPGYPTGRTSVHVGNRIRRDLFLAPSWRGTPRFADYGDGIAMHGFDVPQGDATPGRSMYLEIGWSADGRDDDPGFRVIAFLRDGDSLVTWDVAPGYDWYTVDQWKPRDVVFGKYSLRVPRDLPTGSYDFGLVTFGRDDAVALPTRVPEGAVGGTADDALAAVARGELRWVGLVEVVSKEDDDARLKTTWDALIADAAAGECERAEAGWETLRVRRSDDWRWQEVNRPKIARHLGACWVWRAGRAVERTVKVEHLARARWWDHATPGLAAAADPIADALYAEGLDALAREDWATAYRRFTDVLSIDASRSWARRHAETARDKRLGIDDESVAAREAATAERRLERSLRPPRIVPDEREGAPDEALSPDEGE